MRVLWCDRGAQVGGGEVKCGCSGEVRGIW